jgi:hypothetical protein
MVLVFIWFLSFLYQIVIIHTCRTLSFPPEPPFPSPFFNADALRGLGEKIAIITHPSQDVACDMKTSFGEEGNQNDDGDGFGAQ